MSVINNFKLNQDQHISKVCNKLITFIKSFVKIKPIKNLNKELEKITEIPLEILNKKVYQILYRDYKFRENQFKRYNVKSIIIDFFNFNSIVFLNLLSFFFYQKKNQKKYNLICDHVFDQTDVDRYTQIIKQFNTVCLIGSYKSKNNIKNEEYFIYKNLFFGFSDIKFKTRFLLIFFGFKIFYLSIINRTNYLRIYVLLIYDYLKSNHILSKIVSKYYFTYKFYDTSPIFDYFFKKNGGKVYSCFQKNLLAYPLSCFVYADILFTLGKGQGRICNKLGGVVKKTIPVGSLTMESKWFNKKKDLKNVPKADILIIGINTITCDHHYADKDYEETYYGNYLLWLKNLSKDFPNRRIIIKHHSDYSIDPREKEILNKTGIKIQIDNLSANSTYAYMFKSKIILSFASTMIVEALGHNIKAYFLDPNLKNQQFLSDVQKIKNFRISSYNKLKLKITKFKQKKTIIKNKDSFCLKSNNTSFKISKNLIKSNFN